MAKATISANTAWQKLIDKYDILNKVAANGIFHIKASEIKEFKELVCLNIDLWMKKITHLLI